MKILIVLIAVLIISLLVFYLYKYNINNATEQKTDYKKDSEEKCVEEIDCEKESEEKCVEKDALKIALGLVETEYDIIEFNNNIDDGINDSYKLVEIISYIEFDEGQLEIFLKEINKKGYMVFPGYTNTAFSEMIKDEYKQISGQDEVFRENLFNFYLTKDDCPEADFIHEYTQCATAYLYYWKIDNGEYKVYINYDEQKPRDSDEEIIEGYASYKEEVYD